jgi:hypothetical protein
MDPYQFVRMQLQVDPSNSPGLYLSDGKVLEDYRNDKGIDWQSQLFRNATMQNHELSLRYIINMA